MATATLEQKPDVDDRRFKLAKQREDEPDKYLDIWKYLWSHRDTRWHLDTPNPALMRHKDRLLEGHNADNPVRMLFPLCGKNLDMANFYREGHTVYGVECADEAISDFFTGNGITYATSRLPGAENGKLHSTSDGRLNIVQHNFLTLDNEDINGSVNVVWDRGAFGTITEFEQELYVDSMKRLLAKDFRYLLLVTEFDQEKFQGPPLSQPEERVRKYFGDFCEIERLESIVPDHVKLYQEHIATAIGPEVPMEVHETTYLLTPKK